MEEMMIQIELNELVWRIELDDPFPGNREAWKQFIDALQKGNFHGVDEFYEIDEDGPSERFYVTTAHDVGEGDVEAAVEQALKQALGITPVAADSQD